ncbi:hypothetical protein F4806DRAFT_387120 [Annulohypoxylon nitens]|nr:hypothetical protein F4806DRAFT_387120 [Annulohypoxylon nitens]
MCCLCSLWLLLLEVYIHGTCTREYFTITYLIICRSNRKSISKQGTLLSAAVIGCFSWPSRNTEHWIGSAARYCSLVLSLFAILLSSSQSFIFNAIIQKNSRTGPTTQINSLARDLNMVCHIVWRDRKFSSTVADAGARSSFFFTESESGDDDRETGGRQRAEQQSRRGDSSSSAIDDNDDVIEVHIRWNMVFIWQAPMMLLAYSVLAFLAGLTVYICTPLYNSGLDGKEVAIFYLASLGIGGFCFVSSSGVAFGRTDLWTWKTSPERFKIVAATISMSGTVREIG